MKNNYLICTIVLFLLLIASVSAQAPLGGDKASNYVANGWYPNATGGSGFTPWIMYTMGSGGNAGHFLGNSVADGFGDVNTAGTAFGMYGNPAQGNPEAVTYRYFVGTGSVADPVSGRAYLLPGQIFSIDLAVAYRNGYKGIDLVTRDGQFLWNFGVDNDRYEVNQDNVFDNEYDQHSVFKIEAEQLTDDTYKVKLSRGTESYSYGPLQGKVGGFKLYNSSTQSSDALNNLYFNNLKIERRCAEYTTWNGTSWSNGIPTLAKQAIVEGNLTISSTLSACTLHINGTAVVVALPGSNITVANEITVAAGASFTVKNNANVLQIDNVDNAGSVVVERNSSALKRLDYTLWSAPVAGQGLFQFSPQTLADRFYTYNSMTNVYQAIQGLGASGTTPFAEGKGYLIRTPNNHPATPTIWSGTFTGVLNNGVVPVQLVSPNYDETLRYNLVGNPYPSPISIEAFLLRNANTIEGTLYFWRKTNNPLKSSYSTATLAGFAANSDQAGNALYDPNGVIRTGQGFFVKAKDSWPNILRFNNSMRIADNANQFFRMSELLTENQGSAKSRLWLNITKEGEAFGQAMIAYMNGATTGLDYGIDGEAMNDSGTALYSQAGGKNLAIQGRPLPFYAEDVVPLGFKAAAAGAYSINLDNTDGLFAGSQDIYIKDYLTGQSHNLKEEPYSFSSEAGTFNSRFAIVYQEQALGAPGFETITNIVVYKKDSNLNVDAGSSLLKSVTMYDITGRVVYSKEAISAPTVVIPALSTTSQVLVVKAVTDNGSVTKKVLF